MSFDFTLQNKCVTVCAKRGSGKTVCISWLISLERENFKKIILMCPTEDVDSYYVKKGIVSSKCVFFKFDESFILRLIEKMTNINRGREKTDLEQVLLILDDCISDTRLHDSKAVNLLFTRGRHLGISLIITTQHIKGVPPIARTNSDFVLVGQLNQASIEILAEEFRSGGLDKKQFMQLYNRNTKDYNFLCINNNSTKSNDISEIYATLKTPQEFMNK